MANTSPYRLRAKYENIPLEFGSHILVNNSNITTAYALKLLEQSGGERFFAQLPPPKVKRNRIKKIIEPQGETTDEVVPEVNDIPDNSTPQ